MSRTKLLTIAVLGLLIINLTTLIFMFANKPEDHHGLKGNHPHKSEGPKQLIIDFLNFNSEQQKQYEIIIEEHQSKTKEIKKSLKVLRESLYNELRNNTINNNKVDSIIQKIAENHQNFEHLNFEHFQKIKSICKPNQTELFKDLTEELINLFPHDAGRPPKH